MNLNFLGGQYGLGFLGGGGVVGTAGGKHRRILLNRGLGKSTVENLLLCNSENKTHFLRLVILETYNANHDFNK